LEQFTPGTENICCGENSPPEDVSFTCTPGEDDNNEDALGSYQEAQVMRETDIAVNAIFEPEEGNQCEANLICEADDVSKFDLQWMDVIQDELSSKVSSHVFSHITNKPWIELVRSNNFPYQHGLRCRWCYEALNSEAPRIPVQSPPSQSTPDIVKFNGVM
jgi:hypothetical protein